MSNLEGMQPPSLLRKQEPAMLIRTTVYVYSILISPDLTVSVLRAGRGLD